MLATPQAADKWDLKAALAPKATTTWDLVSSVNQAGEDHTATMKLIISLKDAEKDKPQKATYSWKELLLDGGQNIPDNDWDVTIDGQGGITDSEASDGVEAMQTLLMPMTFIYPDKPVGVGDSWTLTVKAGSDKSDRSYTIEAKADSMDKVGDADAMKVTEKIDQKGDDKLTADGTWWVDKTGKVLKFEVKASGWKVPMAGPNAMDVTFKGTLAK